MKLKTAIVSKIPVQTTIKILNDKGKVIFRKTYAKAPSKTYTIKWDGKPTPKNQAKWKTTAYVPAGIYTVRVTATMEMGEAKKEIVKEKQLIVKSK